MVIYLVQHGKALDKSVDPERGLSAEGIKEIKSIALQAQTAGIKVSSILHSGKLRAEQTAELYASALDVRQVQTVEGIQPKDNVAEFINTHQLQDKSMLVGHLPFMQKLASCLVNGNEENKVIQFQNGGIVCLEQDQSGQWYIKWTLMTTLLDHSE